jgi:hypothetical protein
MTPAAAASATTGHGEGERGSQNTWNGSLVYQSQAGTLNGTRPNARWARVPSAPAATTATPVAAVARQNPPACQRPAAFAAVVWTVSRPWRDLTRRQGGPAGARVSRAIVPPVTGW